MSLLSVHYQTVGGRNRRAIERPVEIRLVRGKQVTRLYLTEAEALALRSLLDGLPDEVLAELPEEPEPRALAPWPKQARF